MPQGAKCTGLKASASRKGVKIQKGGGKKSKKKDKDQADDELLSEIQSPSRGDDLQVAFRLALFPTLDLTLSANTSLRVRACSTSWWRWPTC